MNQKIYFISDIHLGLQSKEVELRKERLLESFLESISGEADQLYILGDLFDYWFEYRRVIQKDFFRTITSVQNLVESGTQIHYLIGNHDFMHRDFFEENLGVKIYEESVIAELNGKKFFLDHGDGFVKGDLGYKILKKILRNKTLQKFYSLVHPDLGIWLASSSSKKSRDFTANKNYGEIDGLSESAKEKIDEGYDYVLFGHSHEREFLEYNNGYYINLGSWLSKPCFGVFNNEKFKIVDWTGKIHEET